MNELQKTKEMTPAVAEYAGKIAEVIQMKAVVQDLLRSQMKEDVHYGKIPGTGDKPTLLKPGAEMLKMVFGLKTYSTKKDIKISKEDNNHKTYEILVHIVIKDNTVATGLGCCSTLESKYRYRSKITDIPVPKEYWENRDNNLLGGQQFSPRKIKGSWLIAERIEHDNPADYYNTVKKMAKKRAMADGILTATGSSDLFTQDLEDLNANWQVYDGVEEKRKNKVVNISDVEIKTKPSEFVKSVEKTKEEDIFKYELTGDSDTDFLLKTIHDVSDEWEKVVKIWPKIQSAIYSLKEEYQEKVIEYKDKIKSFHKGHKGMITL
jgi:hypothetical protein